MKAFIEMTKGDMDKWELNKDTGLLGISRRLDVPVPFNYGFIVGTLAEDGDPLDVFVLGDPIARGTEVDITIISTQRARDNGVSDDKVIAVQSFEFRKIRDYLKTYKIGMKVRTQVGQEESYNRLDKYWVD